MSKSDDQKLAALVKKNAAMEAKPKARDRARRQYDDTLAPEPEDDGEGRRIFSEMKKRDN
ncbi:MAG: hypothetical protein O7D29_07925 [Gemmatimonadetes bacterium]|nr:hypothetical protein [Gemmatimonadota bacterium]